MKKEVLFIQGGGHDGYETDAKLAASLQTVLGKDYEVHYPRMEIDDTVPDFGWLQQIGKEMEALNDGIILVAHSLGASLLLKYLSEENVKKQLYGIFLIATPFWSGEEDWVKGLMLRKDFANRLPRNVPVIFYHSRDDREVSFDHFLVYKSKLPYATFREIAQGGHQLGNDLTPLAKDIKRTIKTK